MKVYRVMFDGDARIVEAPTFGEAVKTWMEHRRDDNGDEEPDAVELLSGEPVIRYPEAVAEEALLRVVRAHGECPSKTGNGDPGQAGNWWDGVGNRQW